MNARFDELMTHLVIAEKAFPKGLNKILVVGFSKAANAVPFATVFDASPATLTDHAKTVGGIFELKGIESYVFCVEVSAIKAEPGMTKEDVEEMVQEKVDRGDNPNNALLMVVNLGDGKPETFLFRPEDNFPMPTMLPTGHPFDAFMGLSPADEPRRIIKKFISELSPDDRSKFESEFEMISYRSDLKDAAQNIARRIDEGRPTVH